LACGVVALRHEMFEVYEQLKPVSQSAPCWPRSVPSSSDGSAVRWPMRWAASWSTEMPTLLVAPVR
jgi:hypothetical protein